MWLMCYICGALMHICMRESGRYAYGLCAGMYCFPREIGDALGTCHKRHYASVVIARSRKQTEDTYKSHVFAVTSSRDGMHQHGYVFAKHTALNPPRWRTVDFLSASKHPAPFLSHVRGMNGPRLRPPSHHMYSPQLCCVGAFVAHLHA